MVAGAEEGEEGRGREAGFGGGLPLVEYEAKVAGGNEEDDDL